MIPYSERSKKTRRKTKYKDIEICVDEVEWLGNFIKVEKMTKTNNTEEIEHELVAFIRQLWLHEKERVYQWYDVLDYKLRNN